MRPGPIRADSRCVNTMPDDDNQMISLHSGSRSADSSHICFECGNIINRNILHTGPVSESSCTQAPRLPVGSALFKLAHGRTESYMKVVLSLRRKTQDLWTSLSPQVRGFSQTGLFWIWPELHSPPQPAPVLGSQWCPVSIHTHWLGEESDLQTTVESEWCHFYAFAFLRCQHLVVFFLSDCADAAL